MLQTADSTYGVIADILIRAGELAMQAATDGIGHLERNALDLEYQQLLLEIDRLADAANYDGITLLGGSNAGDINFNAPVFNYRIGTGIVPDNGTPDSINNILVTLTNINTTTLGLNGTDIHDDGCDTGNGDAAAVLVALQGENGAFEALENARATVGAYMNRLSFADAVIAVSRENAEASRSTLIDADIPEAMAELMAKTVLLEAGFSMLSTSNRIPQSIIGLIRTM
jgi:flagellin